MLLTTNKFIIAIMNSIVFVKADIDLAVITPPAVGMDHGTNFHVSTDKALQRCFRAVGNNFRINFSMMFEYAKNNCFAISTAASYPRDTLSTKIGFIDLYRTLQRAISGLYLLLAMDCR